MLKIKEEKELNNSNNKNNHNLQTTKKTIPPSTSSTSCNNIHEIILPDKNHHHQNNSNHINCDSNNQCNQCLCKFSKIEKIDSSITFGNLEKLYKIKLKTSLQFIYILLGILFLCIFSLTFFLYTYLSNININNNNNQNLYDYDNLKKLLKNNIQNELLLDKNFMENIVFNIQDNNSNNKKFFKNTNYQTDKLYFNYDKLESATLPYDGSQIVQNERKRVIPDTFLSASFKDNENNESENHKRKRRQTSSQSRQAEPLIEFFNPNYRKDMDEQEAEHKRRTGKGSAANGDDWVYLTSYCRVPERTITGFCKGTQDYCPPSPPGPQGPFGPKGPVGPPGLPGVPGQKGNRGDVGLPGPPGLDGREGPQGPRGTKGDSGLPGSIGLDGRDGIPGEPGLDGVPGRAGADGIPGKDGKDGTPGRDGRDGSNGRDGAPGPKGAMGPPGERGLKGIAGPRGRSGKSGINGTPGIPGINAWKVKVNGTYSSELLIPPSIADNNTPNITRTLIVEEGKNLRLVCAANGNPLPHVEWRRTDGRTIPSEREELSSVSGYALIINNITRSHMAAYSCFADNGIPPVANATFLVEVHFSPMISVYRQIIFAIEGASASLECQVEAFPEAIRYWERVSDGKILDPGEKYRIETYPDGFKTTMRLTINNLNFMDFGQYFCVAKNELNSTIASFDVIKKNPSLEIPTMRNEVRIFGSRPPERSCPPPPVCQECADPSEFQCKDDITLNFDIQPTGNYSYPGLPKRESTCVLYAVGKPVFHKSSTDTYGAWLKDAAAKPADKDKIYVTREGITNRLYEYINKNNYRNNIPFRHYEIKEGFMGNTHVVYNGSLFFHQNNTENVTKFDLKKEKVIATAKLPYLGYSDGNTLYTTEHNYMDFNVDDVGLWIIYSTKQSNNTIVAKMDSETLQIQFSWNITLDHHKFGEMFIVCGILYAIDSVTDRTTQIQVAVDLYSGKLLKVDLPFSNPFRKTTTVGYNKHLGELYSWDKGNQLTYPIRANEIIIDDEHLHSNGNGDFSKNMN